MSSQPDPWSAVDHFINEMVVRPDEVFENVLETAATAGLPAIQVTPAQGKLLQILAQLQGARSILEIGTLGGYSTIWLARALPAGGRVITLEINPAHARVARGNFERAKLSGVIDLRVGPALELLPQLAQEGCAPFDLIFVDADKASTPDYFTWALRLCRPGSLIIVDNVVRKGSLVDSRSTDPNVQGMRRFVQLLGAESRVRATVIQTVGEKGYDGLAIAVVNGTS